MAKPKQPKPIETDWRKTHRTWHLPVDDPRHTEVLGYHVSTKAGKQIWKALDWSRWSLDYATASHLFSHANCMYFHVEVRDRPGDPADGRTYRVRCWYAGGKYKGWPVVSVGVGFQDGKLHWIVRGSKEPVIATLPPRLLKAAKEGK